MAFFSVVISTELIHHLFQDKILEQQRTAITEKLSTKRARIEGTINSTLYLTRGLIAYVATHPDINKEKFTLLSSEIIGTEPVIRNIGLAHNNVITYLYPLAGNEAALGVAYKDIPKQWAQVKQAMDLKGTVVAGPVDLLQGGQAFIARTPIYIRDEMLHPNHRGYWGMASIVIDIPTFYHIANIKAEDGDLLFALRGNNATGERGEVFFGDPAIFEHNPVLQNIQLPNGRWQIAAIARYSWREDGSFFYVQLLRLLGWLTACIIAGLIAALIWKHYANKHLALHDPLTGLANRRLLEKRLERLISTAQRDKLNFALLFIDLDGFKHINDNYGHKIGDQFLQIAAQRLQDTFAQSAMVARIGGDEFVVLVPHLSNTNTVDHIVLQLQQHFLGAVQLSQQQLHIKASIGVALFPKDGNSSDALLSAGDRQMYQQKKSHRLHS